MSTIRSVAISALVAWLMIPLSTSLAEELPALTYGGPFKLTDQDGETVTEKDFLGKYMLVTFGYTNCPDVCPSGLYTMSTAIKRLGEAGEAVVPVFVSVDPARDTVEKLKAYVTAFHPRMVGMTGDKQAVFDAARAFRVFYFVGELEGRYVVDHTANYYLMGPDGEFLAILPYGTTPDDMATAIGKYL